MSGTVLRGLSHGKMKSTAETVRRSAIANGDLFQVDDQALLRVEQIVTRNDIRLVNAVTGERLSRTRAQVLRWWRFPGVGYGRKMTLELAKLLAEACRHCGVLRIDNREKHTQACDALSSVYQPAYFIDVEFTGSRR